MNSPVNPNAQNPWRVGAAEVDITPSRSMFLYGYPHEQRMSTGTHDPLLASAIWLEAGGQRCLFIGCDLIWLPRPVTDRARETLSASLGVPAGSILISATHTHSGPVTATMLSNTADPVVPEPDADYLAQVEAGIVQAATEAQSRAEPAIVSQAVAKAPGLGGNRRDPDGPTIPHVPIVCAQSHESGRMLAVMSVCAMHPTVLHEDSTVYSGDFPGLARQALKQRHFTQDTVYLHHMGASGNQSPRRAVEANTFAEAQRLGDHLAEAIRDATKRAAPITPVAITTSRTGVELPLRELPSPEQAEAQRDEAVARLEELRRTGAERVKVRTAETDWFGAEETLTLAKAAHDGQLEDAAQRCMPAEVQVIRLGEHTFVGWPGEVFIEFALEVMASHPDASVITLAGGDLQGYLVTQQAVDERAYESGNAIFASPASGEKMVRTTLKLLSELEEPACRTS